MTSTDAIAAMIRADFEKNAENLYDHANTNTFKLIRDLMLHCSLELTAALRDNNPNYYFSDSTYDEIRNPASIIADCTPLIDNFYDDELLTDADIQTLTSNLDYALDYELEEFTTIDEIRAALLA